MKDQEELVLAGNDPDPVFLELTEQIAQKLQTGEPVDAADYVGNHPQWAGAICKLLPTLHDLVDYARTVDRDLRRQQHQVNPHDANDRTPKSKEAAR